MSLTKISNTVTSDSSSSSYMFRNLIINGSMNIHQRGASVSGITASSFNTADRWVVDIVNAFGTWTQSVELADAPTGSGLRKSLKMLCTTNVASPTAGNLIKIRQTIEAQNCNILKKGTPNAESFTVSFWVKSNVTGTYVVDVEDQTNSRLINNSYTIISSGVWEKKNITFSGDTTGALNNDNGVGLLLSFYLGVGSNYTSGSLQTSWASNSTAGNKGVGQVNAASSTNNYWQITGIQMEVGNTPTSFENLPYEIQLMRCQRYYTSYTISQDYNDGSNNGVIHRAYSLPVPMRIAPTPSVLSQFTYYSSTTPTNVTPTFASSINSVSVIASGTTAGRGLVGGTFGASAEL